MKYHVVKSWKTFYKHIASGAKKHDLRVNDRDYKVGDKLELREYDQEAGEYTGRRCVVLITFITSNRFPCAFSCAALDRDYAILSLEIQK